MNSMHIRHLGNLGSSLKQTRRSIGISLGLFCTAALSPLPTCGGQQDDTNATVQQQQSDVVVAPAASIVIPTRPSTASQRSNAENVVPASAEPRSAGSPLPVLERTDQTAAELHRANDQPVEISDRPLSDKSVSSLRLSDAPLAQTQNFDAIQQTSQAIVTSGFAPEDLQSRASEHEIEPLPPVDPTTPPVVLAQQPPSSHSADDNASGSRQAIVAPAFQMRPAPVRYIGDASSDNQARFAQLNEQRFADPNRFRVGNLADESGAVAANQSSQANDQQQPAAMAEFEYLPAVASSGSDPLLETSETNSAGSANSNKIIVAPAASIALVNLATKPELERLPSPSPGLTDHHSPSPLASEFDHASIVHTATPLLGVATDHSQMSPIESVVNDSNRHGLVAPDQMAAVSHSESSLADQRAFLKSQDLATVVRHVTGAPVVLTRLPAVDPIVESSPNRVGIQLSDHQLNQADDVAYTTVTNSRRRQDAQQEQDEQGIERLVLKDISDINFSILAYQVNDSEEGSKEPKDAYSEDFEVAEQTSIVQNMVRVGDVYGEESMWLPSRVEWAAPNFYHRPLYFEEVNLERYGHQAPRFQSALSAVQFYGNLLTLPYQAYMYRPCEPIYTLGHHRPGSCNPHQIHYFPLTR